MATLAAPLLLAVALCLISPSEAASARSEVGLSKRRKVKRCWQLSMISNPDCTKIALHRAGIGDEGAIQVAEALKSNSKLSFLVLSANLISDVGVESITEALQGHSSAANLWMADNEIGDAGAGAVAKLLMGNRVVNSVDLAENHIGNQGGLRLLEALSRKHSNVTEFDISENLLSKPLQLLLAATVARNAALAVGNQTRVGECDLEIAQLHPQVFSANGRSGGSWSLHSIASLCCVCLGLVFCWRWRCGCRNKKALARGLPLSCAGILEVSKMEHELSVV